MEKDCFKEKTQQLPRDTILKDDKDKLYKKRHPENRLAPSDIGFLV